MEHALIRARDEAFSPDPGRRYFADADTPQAVNADFADTGNVVLSTGEIAGGFIVRKPGRYRVRAEVGRTDAYVTFHAGVLTGTVDEHNEMILLPQGLVIPPVHQTSSAEVELALLPGDTIYPHYLPTKPAKIVIGAVTLTRVGAYESSMDLILHAGLRDTPYRSPWDIASACAKAKITPTKTAALFKALGLDPPPADDSDS